MIPLQKQAREHGFWLKTVLNFAKKSRISHFTGSYDLVGTAGKLGFSYPTIQVYILIDTASLRMK